MDCWPVDPWCVSLQRPHNPCAWPPPSHTGPSESPRRGGAQGWGAAGGSVPAGAAPAPPGDGRTPHSSASCLPWISGAPLSGCLWLGGQGHGLLTSPAGQADF